jgi:hypothetical protein
MSIQMIWARIEKLEKQVEELLEGKVSEKQDSKDSKPVVTPVVANPKKVEDAKVDSSKMTT